jgi:hypothetical protein
VIGERCSTLQEVNYGVSHNGMYTVVMLSLDAGGFHGGL